MLNRLNGLEGVINQAFLSLTQCDQQQNGIIISVPYGGIKLATAVDG